MKRSAVEENKIGSEIGLLEVLEYENSQVHQSQILIYFVYHAFKGELLKNFAHECEYFDMRLRKSALITVLRINRNKRQCGRQNNGLSKMFMP